MRSNDHLPLCTIAGSDPTGCAGVFRDLMTFSDHGGTGAAVITALTVQGERGLEAVHPVPTGHVLAQLDRVLGAAPPAAIKTGMLVDGPTVAGIAALLERLPRRPPLVVDPVLAASRGGRLLDDAGQRALLRHLVPQADLLTPNLPEAAQLLGVPRIAPGEEAHAAQALRQLGCRAVLLKGGHAEGELARDWLVTADGTTCLDLPRLAAGARGTGCSLASAIAARLGRGEELKPAVRTAKAWLHTAIQRATAGRLPHPWPAP